MSKRYWLADLHFGHANIVKYCKRPTFRKNDFDENNKWLSPEIAIEAAKRMDEFLIKRINGRVNPEDSVIHIGDFMNKGVVKGIPGLKNKSMYYLNQFNGYWTLFLGNHDPNNSVKTIASSMFTTIGPYKVFVSHYPIENIDKYHPKFIDYIIQNTNFQLCGHVHNAWKHKWFQYGNFHYLMYNIGVDANRYLPIPDDEIIVYYERCKKREINE